MSDHKRESIMSAISAPPEPGTKLSALSWAVRAIVIAVPVLGTIPTAMNVYHSWMHDIPYSEVSHRLAQYDLWTKNFECKIDYKELTTAQGTKVNVGACPRSGDIAIKLATAGGQARYEWIAFDKIAQPKKTAGLGLLDLIATPAVAEESPKAGGAPIRLAQAGGMEVVCQARQGQSMIVRIVKEGPKCYREHFSPFQGRVEKREEVPCNTACPSSR